MTTNNFSRNVSEKSFRRKVTDKFSEKIFFLANSLPATVHTIDPAIYEDPSLVGLLIKSS